MNIQALKFHVTKFLKEEDGLTTVEYAIAGSLVGLAVVTAFTELGTAVAAIIGELKNQMCSGTTVC